MYRPKINKTNYNSLIRFSKFFKQIYDKNDWAVNKSKRNRKKQTIQYNLRNDIDSHTLKTRRHCVLRFRKGKYFGKGKSRTLINSIDDIYFIHPEDEDYMKQKEEFDRSGKLDYVVEYAYTLESHLQAGLVKDTLNYIYYVNSPFCSYNLIVLDFDDCDDFSVVISFISEYFPNCYHDISSSGKGLHYYILISYESGSDISRFFDESNNEGEFRNALYKSLGEALKKHIQYLCGVKATCSIYGESKKDLIKCGTLCKLPVPVTYDDFYKLYNCSVFNLYYVLCVINYLNDTSCNYSSLLDTSSFSGKSEKSSLSEQKLLDAHKCAPITIKTGKKEKGREKIDENDSLIYESRFIASELRKNKDITEEEAYNKYLEHRGYTKRDDKRRERFNASYKFVKNTYKNDFKNKTYKLYDHIEKITWTDEEITTWCKNNTSFKRNVYRTDLDLCLGYIFTCNMNIENRRKNTAIKRLMTSEGVDRDTAKDRLNNTCSIRGLMDFIKFKKIEYSDVKINRCNKHKAGALIKILLHLHLIDCISDDFSFGVARKYNII